MRPGCLFNAGNRMCRRAAAGNPRQRAASMRTCRAAATPLKVSRPPPPPALQLFVSSLRGMGLHCKAVCSFQQKQLKARKRCLSSVAAAALCLWVWGARAACRALLLQGTGQQARVASQCTQRAMGRGSLPEHAPSWCLQIPPAVANTVLFFHGLSGLENACDAGQARRCGRPHMRHPAFRFGGAA